MTTLALTPVHAAITLTIDTAAKTFTWTGSATSDPFAVAEGGFEFIRLGSGTWNGGTVSGTGEDALSADIDFGNGWPVYFSSSVFIGQLVVAELANTIVADLGFISNSFSDSGERTGTISVVGNGAANSYAGYLDESAQFLESLQGVDLYFQNNGGGAGVTNIGAPAGQIIVIPEPASAILVAFGALGIFRRRR